MDTRDTIANQKKSKARHYFSNMEISKYFIYIICHFHYFVEVLAHMLNAKKKYCRKNSNSEEY